MKDIFRWILVFPAAIASYFVASAFCYLANKIAGLMYEQAWSQNMLGLIQMVAASIAYIWFGSLVAPSYRFTTAIVLSAIYATLMLVFIIWIFVEIKTESLLTLHMAWNGVCFLASVAACFLTLPSVKEREKNIADAKQLEIEQEAVKNEPENLNLN